MLPMKGMAKESWWKTWEIELAVFASIVLFDVVGSAILKVIAGSSDAFWFRLGIAIGMIAAYCIVRFMVERKFNRGRSLRELLGNGNRK